MNNNGKIKVVHLISGLGTGGAEVMLYELIAKTDRNIFDPEVISITDIGPIGEKIKSLGVKVGALNLMFHGMPNPLIFFKLLFWLNRIKPAIMQTWMYHADLLGGLVAKLLCIPVVWGIHHTDLDPDGSRKSTIWIARTCARLSRSIPQKIICCSEASKDSHDKLGYDSQRMVVIPNGFDLESFMPDHPARLSVRQELGVNDDCLLIGMAARFNPQKDHQNFIQSAAELYKKNPDVHYLLCGDMIDKNNDKLKRWIRELGLENNFHLLGRREDMPRILSSLDIFSISSSFGEAFPLVIGEAMACSVPCVATDVGDSAIIIGDTGKIVPPKDPVALARAWKYLLDMDEKNRLVLGNDARQRVLENFSIASVVAMYNDQYLEIIEKNRNED